MTTAAAAPEHEEQHQSCGNHYNSPVPLFHFLHLPERTEPWAYTRWAPPKRLSSSSSSCRPNAY